MTRSTFRPLRTRRLPLTSSGAPALTPVRLTKINPQTRQALAALGAVCLAFARTTGAAN
jgi:hypothetical protein